MPKYPKPITREVIEIYIEDGTILENSDECEQPIIGYSRLSQMRVFQDANPSQNWIRIYTDEEGIIVIEKSVEYVT